MKINSISKQNFTSTPLYKAQLEEYSIDTRETSPVDVFITKLDETDEKRINDNWHYWRDLNFYVDIMNMIDAGELKTSPNSPDSTHFYAVEVPDLSGNLEIRGISIATENNDQKEIYLNFIETFNKAYFVDIISGIGDCLLYPIINMAQRKKVDKIDLASSFEAEPFYFKNGFDKKNIAGDFEMKNNKFKEIQKMLQKKHFIEKLNMDK